MTYDDLASEILALQESYETAGMDLAAPDSARWLSQAAEDPVALYVGKLIVSKGVDLLIAGWPLVRQKHPNAKLAIVGFGAYREGLELLVAALSQGDLTTARWIAAGGRAFEGGPKGQLKHVLAFFDTLEGDVLDVYVAAAKDMAESIRWFGRLDHAELASIIPAVNCQVIPSTFPEAFGMVAAEAAACGVPPISADHSGLAEVTKQLEENLSGASGALLSFGIDDFAVDRLSNRVSGVFGLGLDERREMAARLVATAVQRFSWGGVASDVADAARGVTANLRQP